MILSNRIRLTTLCTAILLLQGVIAKNLPANEADNLSSCTNSSFGQRGI